MPKGPGHEKLKACVRQVSAKGKDTSASYAVCTASLQKAGIRLKGKKKGK